MGGFAIRNPLETAEFALKTPKIMMRHLVLPIFNNVVLFDSNEHCQAVSLSLASVSARQERLTREQLVLEDCSGVDSATKPGCESL